MGDDWRATRAAALRAGLTRNVIDPWFPRSIDHNDGGFLSGFDHRWRPIGAQDRLLEFQARQTRTAARLGVALPADARWPEYVRHGMRYLDRVMRDHQHGGWFAQVDRGGQPQLGATKDAHGTAYVISCGVEAHKLTGDARPLEIAHQAFEWLETTLHDDDYGAYHGWATRQGKAILSKADLPPDLAHRTVDHLGHGIGLKDANVHSDLLEAFTLLAGVSTDTRVHLRLAEVYDVLTQHFISSAGAVHYLLLADLAPVPGLEHYGYPAQTGYRLPAAAKQLGRSVDQALALARRMLDHVLEWGWDADHGGFVEAGPAAEPRALGGVQLRLRKRPWWVQTEAAKLLLRLALVEPAPGRYRAHFDQLMDVLDREFVDQRHGGWEMKARSDWGRRQRWTGRDMPKSDNWKDASHEADFHLAAIRLLRNLEPDAPID